VAGADSNPAVQQLNDLRRKSDGYNYYERRH
jgi:hypothetical protein